MLDLTKVFVPDNFTTEGDMVFPRVYASLYCNSFVEDSRPDYYVTREVFYNLLKEVYGSTGEPIYKSYMSGKCLQTIVIPEFKVMLIVTFMIPEDMVDRKYRYSNKDLDFIEELGDIDTLQEKLNTTSMSAYDTFALAPSVKDEELSNAILRVYYYPSEHSDLAQVFNELYDNKKFERTFDRIVINDSIYTLGQNNKGLVLHKHYLDNSKYKVDIIASNYNDNFQNVYEKITKFLKNDVNGLILLTGEPGTGKSSFLMHLTSVCQEMNTRFIFIPSAFAFVLSDPEFLPFAVANLNNSVIILEDAEDVLKARDAGGTAAVSNILNITDGILGKLIKVKIIATVNKAHIIDNAIVRKGRLKLSYAFEKLSVDKANKLYIKLGKEDVVDKPVTLAEIYNSDNNVIQPLMVERKIGF